MIASLILLMAAAAAAGEPGPSRLPPKLPPVPELPAAEPAAIFTYSVDGQCRVDEIRKLQGPNDVGSRDLEQRVYRERTVWRFVDGERLQLRERRVQLLGEMVLEGELVCHVRPAGGVVEAWIEREDSTGARRRAPSRVSVRLIGDAIEHLGTFSVELPAPERR